MQEDRLSYNTTEQSIHMIDRDLKNEYQISAATCEQPKLKLEIIFLTGATGYSGAHVLHGLLQSTDCKVRNWEI